MSPSVREPDKESVRRDLYVLWEEFKLLHGTDHPIPESIEDPPPKERSYDNCPAFDGPWESYDEFYKRVHDLKDADGRTALCLSGGGIRSAAFNLCVLQGLAKSGLLKKFTYLSMVSGGGYIGAWLTLWRRRCATEKGGLENVLSGLAWPDPTSSADPPSTMPEALRNLRSKTSYLAPRMGLLSADTWTAIILYFRNFLLNQLLLLPLLIAAVTLPKIALCAIRLWPTPRAPFYFSWVLVVIGWTALTITRPAWRALESDKSESSNDTTKERRETAETRQETVRRIAVFGCILIFVASISFDIGFAGEIAIAPTSPLIAQLWSLPMWGAAAGLAALSITACCVNVNRFSLHDVYRLRLMREFLGASNTDHNQEQDGWTGFTHTDDHKFSDTWERRPDKDPLYPIFNATLNISTPNRLDMQE
jgi:hypothetical protein